MAQPCPIIYVPLVYRQTILYLAPLAELFPWFCSLLSYRGLLDLALVVGAVARLALWFLSVPPLFEVAVEPLQDVDGVVDEEGQPGQAEEDPRGHEDAVPLGVCFVRIAVWKGTIA